MKSKQTLLNNILLFGPKTIYSVEEGVVEPKFRGLDILGPDHFLYFSPINLELSLMFQTQMEFLREIVNIYFQMYACYINYKNQCPISQESKPLK